MTPMDEPLEERIVELELRYAHLQDLVEKLSDVIVTQQREIDDLARRLRELALMGSPMEAGGEGPRGPQDV